MGQEQSNESKKSILGYEVQSSNNNTKEKISDTIDLATSGCIRSKSSCGSEASTAKGTLRSGDKAKKVAKRYFIFLDQGIERIVPELDSVDSSSIVSRRDTEAASEALEFTPRLKKPAYSADQSCHSSLGSFQSFSAIATQLSSPNYSTKVELEFPSQKLKDYSLAKPIMVEEFQLKVVREKSLECSPLLSQDYEYLQLDLGCLLGI